MEKAIKFLGACILISSLLISATFIYNNISNQISFEKQSTELSKNTVINKYEIKDGGESIIVLDKATGVIYRLTVTTDGPVYRKFELPK